MDEYKKELNDFDLREKNLVKKYKATPTQRKCLRCNKGFRAKDRYFRICDRCKKKEQWRFDQFFEGL